MCHGGGGGCRDDVRSNTTTKGPAPHRCGMSAACSSRTKALWSKVWHLGYGKRGVHPRSLENLQTRGDRHYCTDNSVACASVIFLEQDPIEVLLYRIIARASARPCSTISLNKWKSSSPLASTWLLSKPRAADS